MQLQVGVKVLIKNSKGQYLLMQRSQPLPDGTSWDIPGGRINPDERLEDALSREVLEETGTTLTSVMTLLQAQDIFVEKAGLHVVRLTYATISEKEVALSDEHQNFRWVSLEEAKELPIDPYLRDVLETL